MLHISFGKHFLTANHYLESNEEVTCMQKELDISRKYLLTLTEASMYTKLGVNKLRE